MQTTGADAEMSPTSDRGSSAASAGILVSTSPVTVPLIAETAEVEKTTVDLGGYRVSKRVESHDETVSTATWHQEVIIDRRAIGQQLPPGERPEPYYEGETFVIPVLREILVTEKRLVLIEEIRVQTLERQEPISRQVTLRHEEVTVEKLRPDNPDSTAGRVAPGSTTALPGTL